MRVITESDRLKGRAWNRVHWAIKKGVLKRPEICPKCNKEKYIAAHHTDYEKPLDVTWMCWTCHWKEHYRLRKEPKPKEKESKFTPFLTDLSIYIPSRLESYSTNFNERGIDRSVENCTKK